MIVTFTLPKKVKLLVKTGDSVDVEDRLCKSSQTSLRKINIAEKLHVKPDDIFQFLEKIIGEEVEKGELLAKKRRILGSSKIHSDCSGKVKEIDHITGALTILAEDEDISQIAKCGFRGIIEDTSNNKLKISVNDGYQFAVVKVTNNGAGPAVYVDDESVFFRLTEDQVKDKIIVIQELNDHMEAKCEALGCAGFVFFKGNPYTDLPYAKLATDVDYAKLAESKKGHIIFSRFEKVGVAYD